MMAKKTENDGNTAKTVDGATERFEAKSHRQNPHIDIEPPPFSDPRITHEKKRGFLAAFANTGNVSRAAATAGINRRTHNLWLKADAHYAESFTNAREHAADSLEEVDRAADRSEGQGTLRDRSMTIRGGPAWKINSPN